MRESGKPIVNKVCSHSADRSTNIKIVSIFPVRDRRGRIIGTTAIHRAQPAKERTPDWYGKVRRAVAYIDEHYAERLNLAQLAAEAGLAPSTFSHAFKRITEISPARYVATIRINRARELLAKTDRTILDIALECGFYDQSHFIRTFKSLRHMTPLAYRRNSQARQNFTRQPTYHMTPPIG